MNQVARNFATQNYHAPGIYFGLSEDAYHADHALGSGSIRALANHPMYYWRDSWMNPLRRQDEETPALLFGRALHKLVLEGIEAFHKSYQPAPRKADHPLAFDTATQIKGKLKELGQKQTGAKPELVARLKAAMPEAIFWEDIEGSFEGDCRRKGITPLKRHVYEAVVSAASFIAGDERVAPAFQGGISEISIFIEIDGVPVKCRLDYLRFGYENQRTIGLITDLKSFTNIMEIPPERAVASSIANTKLPTQAALYLEIADQIPALIADGKVFGAEHVPPAFLDQLAKLGPGDFRWFWCFFEKEAPINMLRTPAKDVLDIGRSELSRALQSYREHMDRFGTAWRFVDPMPDITITLQDLPAWLGR